MTLSNFGPSSTPAKDAARGQWPQILSTLAGLTSEQLTPNKHQPCPACGGEDRYRFIDKDGTGSWFCNGCGGRDGRGGGGHGLGLLMRVRGITYAEACRQVEQHLGLPTATPAPRRPARHLAPVPDPPSPPVLATLDEPVELQHPYSYSDTQRVVRIEAKGGKKKRFAVFHREAPGADWQAGKGAEEWPILGKALVHAQRAWVLEAEGEKCTGIFLAAGVVAYCHPGHAHKLEQCRERYRAMAAAGVPGVVLVSDADEEGQRRAGVSLKAAEQAGLPMLHVPATSVWEGLPQGGSIDDAPGTIDEQLDALERAVTAAWEAAQQPPEPEAPVPAAWTAPAPFQALGQTGDSFVYRTSSGELVTLPRSRHTSVCLVSLAPIAYWEASFPSTSGKGGPNWLAAASELFDQQRRMPPFCPDRIRGRGMWVEGDRRVWHLGDRLVVDGQLAPLGHQELQAIYDRRPRLTVDHTTAPITDQQGLSLLLAVEAMGWDRPTDHLLLIGWTVNAAAGGAVRHRPGLDVTARSGAGKSTAEERVIAPLLGDACLSVTAATEAGIRQEAGTDALPVVVDEAEAAEGSDNRARLLRLLRHSYDGKPMVKGTAGHQAQRFPIRFAMCLIAVNATKAEATDANRIATITRRHLPVSQWQVAEAELRRLLTPAFSAGFQRRIFDNLHTLKANALAFSRAVMRLSEEGAEDRDGDTYGPLLAGAFLLTSTAQVDDAQAAAWLTAMGWNQEAMGNGDSDGPAGPDAEGRRLVGIVLAHETPWRDPSRGEADTGRITLAELIDYARRACPQAGPAADALARYGLRVSEAGLQVTTQPAPLAPILKGTRWENGGHTARLRDLPRARADGKVRIMRGTNPTQCTLIPWEVIG